MKRSLSSAALGLALPLSAVAQEEDKFQYGVGVGFFVGVPVHNEDEEPQKAEFQPAFDAHGDIFATLVKGEVFRFQGHVGANVGFVMDAPGLELEIKPLGVHLHCEEGPCQPAYSFESMASFQDFNIGFTFGLSADEDKYLKVTEMSLPLSYKGIFISPYGHAHPEEPLEFGVQLGFHVQLKKWIGLAPSISIQKDAIHGVLRVSFGHFHPY